MRARVAVEQAAGGAGEAVDGGHVGVVEREAGNVEVFGAAGGVGGFRDRQDAELIVPAQDDLRRAARVLVRDRDDRGFREQRAVPLPIGVQAWVRMPRCLSAARCSGWLK